VLLWGCTFSPKKADDLCLVVVTFKPTLNVQTLNVKTAKSVGIIWQLIGGPLATGASRGTTGTMVNPALVPVDGRAHDDVNLVGEAQDNGHRFPDHVHLTAGSLV